MTQREFLEKLADVMQMEEVPSAEFKLSDTDYWDSVSQMSMLAFFHKYFGINVPIEDLAMVENVGDLLDIARSYLSE